MNSFKVVMVALMLAGCGGDTGPKAFTCVNDSQCTVGGVAGKCIKSQCAVPSSRCPSGYVFDSSAGSLAGTCLPEKGDLTKLCLSNDDCLSGFCSDGVCCDADCSGSCHSCNAPGTAGHCIDTPLNQADPKKVCIDDGTVCGHSGLCDGNGGCLFAPPTKACSSPACSNGVVSEAAMCTGSGTCGAPVTHVCDPFVCNTDGSDCFSMCTDNNQCKAPNTCMGGSCGKLANGGKCTDGTSCQSGNCVDGTCCSVPSCGTCFRCDVNGAGTCAPAPAHTVDPTCAAQDKSTCGMSNQCDGAGHCAPWPDGTACSNFGCLENTSPTSTVWTQEMGVCQAGACSKPDPRCGAVLCYAPYQNYSWRCNTNPCNCDASGMQCAPGYTCQQCVLDPKQSVRFGKCL